MSTAARIDELRSKFDENPRRYFAPLANEYRKSGDLTQAIALCREHLPKQPGHMSGHIVFGQALFENGDLSEAQQVFEAALALDPENLIALRHLGDIARAQGDAALARRWYERVLEADPRNNDIAALLESLTQRLSPRSVTPVAVPTVQAPDERVSVALDGAQDAEPTDAPGWHTPSFLTDEHVGTSAAAPDTGPADAAAEMAPEAELLDLDMPTDESVMADAAGSVELTDGFESTQNVSSSAEDVDLAADDLLDQALADQVNALSDAPTESLVDGRVDAFEALLPAEASGTATPRASETVNAALGAFAAHDPSESTDLPAPAEELIGFEATDVGSGESVARTASDAPADDQLRSGVHDAVSATDDATGADTVSALGSADVVDAEFDGSVDDALTGSLHDLHDEFEAGLVAQAWPDAELINVRPATPAIPSASVTPASRDLAAEPDVSEPSEPASVESALGESAAPEPEVPEEMVSSAGERARDAESVAAGAELDAATDSVDEPEDAVDPLHDWANLARGATPATVEAVDDAPVEEEAEEQDPVEAELMAEPMDAEDWVEPVSAFVDAVDEDLPVSAAADPWPEMEEEEREATDVLFAAIDEPGEASEAVETANEPEMADAVSASVESEVSGAVESEAESEAESEVEAAVEVPSDSDAGSPDAAPTPAFVTETMAELFVAQGFLDRAVTVYEELVQRRPYDAVLSSRLDELRALADSDEAPVAEATTAEATTAEVERGGEVTTEAAWMSDRPTPLYGSTPVSSRTPVTSATPAASETPIASPVVPVRPPAVPFAAPVAERTARQVYAALAARRVARRTPVSTPVVASEDPVGAVAGSAADADATRPAATAGAEVDMSTPADGLASLFGETPLPADDVAARSLARAFGDDDVPPGPSLFTSDDDAEDAPAARVAPGAAAAAATPAAGSPAFSFDRFFPDPATAAPDSAPSGAARNPQADQPGKTSESSAAGAAGADLAQFAHWLKGLSNS